MPIEACRVALLLSGFFFGALSSSCRPGFFCLGVIPLRVVADRQDPRAASVATDVSPESPREIWLVSLDPTGALVPGECACCGEPAAASRVERQLVGEGSLIVPYCRACHRHAAASSTRKLAIVLASSLLALALAAGVPIALPWAGVGALLSIVLIGALLPLGLAFRRKTRRAPHTTVGRAVWWSPLGAACSSVRWARRLADMNGAACRTSTEVETRLSPWMVAGPMLGLVVAPFAHWLHHPLVRIVNLTEHELVVSVDGHQVARVAPTSVEHPEAGVEAQIPAGRRRFQVHDRQGRLLEEDGVLVRSGRQHLYAPGDHDKCFWIETIGYGRGGPGEPEVTMLPANRHFWLLPPGLDTWFDRTPRSPDDWRASGGQLTALRQGGCASAPAQE